MQINTNVTVIDKTSSYLGRTGTVIRQNDDILVVDMDGRDGPVYSPRMTWCFLESQLSDGSDDPDAPTLCEGCWEEVDPDTAQDTYEVLCEECRKHVVDERAEYHRR